MSHGTLYTSPAHTTSLMQLCVLHVQAGLGQIGRSVIGFKLPHCMLCGPVVPINSLIS